MKAGAIHRDVLSDGDNCEGLATSGDMNGSVLVVVGVVVVDMVVGELEVVE